MEAVSMSFRYDRAGAGPVVENSMTAAAGPTRIKTLLLDVVRHQWKHRVSYERFERIISRILLALISIIIVYALILAGIELVNDIQLGKAFLDSEVLQDAFGSLLTVLILLEFNHSISTAMRTRSGAIQVRVVVLIAILVIARKLILLDYRTVKLETLLGLGGLSLSLGVLYWLLADGDRRRPAPETPPPDR
jgi:uncharacterized membrane protein (DUF373 family)